MTGARQCNYLVRYLKSKETGLERQVIGRHELIFVQQPVSILIRQLHDLVLGGVRQDNRM